MTADEDEEGGVGGVTATTASGVAADGSGGGIIRVRYRGKGGVGSTLTTTSPILNDDKYKSDPDGDGSRSGHGGGGQRQRRVESKITGDVEPLFGGVRVIFHVHSHMKRLKEQLAAFGAVVLRHDDEQDYEGRVKQVWDDTATTHVVSTAERLAALADLVDIPTLLARGIALVSPDYFTSCLAKRALLPLDRAHGLLVESTATEDTPPAATQPSSALAASIPTAGAPSIPPLTLSALLMLGDYRTVYKNTNERRNSTKKKYQFS
jgi:hypothetical protein